MHYLTSVHEIGSTAMARSWSRNSNWRCYKSRSGRRFHYIRSQSESLEIVSIVNSYSGCMRISVSDWVGRL